MNITLNTEEGQTTFYSITAIQKTDDPQKTFVYSQGHKFIAQISFAELWEKIKRHQDESATR
jgi:hypothetical protein